MFLSLATAALRCACPLELHVGAPTQHSADDMSGPLPPLPDPEALATIDEANDALSRCAARTDCSTATVWLHPGVHRLVAPLTIGSNRSGSLSETWRAAAPGAVVSGGVAMTNWTQAAPGRWVASLRGLGEVAANPKSVRIGTGRAAQATYPAADAAHAVSRYLYARRVAATNVTNDTFYVDLDADKLPANWANWRNLVAFAFPGNSWVSLRVAARPSVPHLGPDGLALRVHLPGRNFRPRRGQPHRFRWRPAHARLLGQQRGLGGRCGD